MSGLIRLFRRLCCLAALAAAASVARAETPPLTAYGSLPAVEDMVLSNSGNRIAALTTISGERAIIMLDERFQLTRMIKVGDEKIRWLEWIGEDHLLIHGSRTQNLSRDFTADQAEIWQAVILPANEAEEGHWVFAEQRNVVDAVFGSYGLRAVDGRWIGFFGGVETEASGATAHFRPALYAVDLAENRARKIARAPREKEDADWLLAADGTVAATFTINTQSGQWTIDGPRGSPLASGTAPTGGVGLIALGADGSTVIYSQTDRATGTVRWFEVALDGATRAVEFLPGIELERLYVDDESGRVLGYLPQGESREPHFFAAAHQAAVRKIFRAFPQHDMRLVDWTPDFSRAIVRVSGNGDSGTWYFVDVAQLQAHAIGVERGAIPPEQVGPISRVDYTAADGLALDGILTLPPGREARNLPLVMLPHGGPHAHDIEAFDWWAQAFASRGYAVFQPNFRGSTNRDRAFETAGDGEWGRKMQSDISDGLAELVRQGIVDPERVCIAGASYGGYAALAGVTLQQGLYRCAVAVAGVSDIARMYSNDYREGGNSQMLKRSLLEELGPRSGFDAISPRRFAARADAPILLIHGKDDTVVPFAQSDDMADALKDAGKPYKLVVLREEDHWLSRAATRRQMLEEAVAFVEQHNPPD